MDQQNASLMAALLLFLGAPFLFVYVWQTKRASRLLWRAYALFLMVCGGAFAAGVVLAPVTEFSFHAVDYATPLGREASAAATQISLNLIAVLAASLAGLCVARKIIDSVRTREPMSCKDYSVNHPNQSES